MEVGPPFSVPDRLRPPGFRHGLDGPQVRAVPKQPCCRGMTDAVKLHPWIRLETRNRLHVLQHVAKPALSQPAPSFRLKVSASPKRLGPGLLTRCLGASGLTPSR